MQKFEKSSWIISERVRKSSFLPSNIIKLRIITAHYPPSLLNRVFLLFIGTNPYTERSVYPCAEYYKACINETFLEKGEFFCLLEQQKKSKIRPQIT